MKKIITLFLSLIMAMALFVPCMAAETNESGKAEDTAPESNAAETLEDGLYIADFNTDSTMFHANEACEGKGILIVKNGEMTMHAALVSKSILNLFLGTAEDAQKDGAELLEPTTDTVTYTDGYEETVYGFNIPVTVLDEEFDLAIIGKKEKWYDHKVSVSNPEPVTIEGLDLNADKLEITYEFEAGGKVSFEYEPKTSDD